MGRTEPSCPYRTGTYINLCDALKGGYAPSAFQVTEYCTGAWYSLCPLFRNRQVQDEDHALAAAAGGWRR